MSWTSLYRLALHLLPDALRQKHGLAMEALFARELGQARGRGRLHAALAGAAAVLDIVQRGAYEQLRSRHDALAGHPDRRSWGRWSTHTPGPQPSGATLGGPHMPHPTARQLLRRHAASFAVASVALTALLLIPFAMRQLPALRAQGAGAGAMVEALLLAVPFVLALTLPMAVLIAVLREFSRLGANGTLAAARRDRDGLRRLVVPVLGAAAGIAILTLAVAAEVVPRTNERLAAMSAFGAAAPADRPLSDREMTIGQLREAARTARGGTEPAALARAAAYEVEVQKKLALPVACVVFALAGVAIALRVPRGGTGLVIGASGAVFGAYYLMLLGGEVLADRMVVSPFVGMWGANAVLLTAALLAVWRRPVPRASGGSPAIAVN